MNRKTAPALLFGTALLAGSFSAPAQNSELDQLKETIHSMEQTIEQMKMKIAGLEKQKTQAPPASTNALEATSPSIQIIEEVAVGELVGEQSAPTFYHTSQYASANIIWQMSKRLRLGLEGLYGLKTAQNDLDSGNHWRIQFGMLYSLFD